MSKVTPIGTVADETVKVVEAAADETVKVVEAAAGEVAVEAAAGEVAVEAAAGEVAVVTNKKSTKVLIGVGVAILLISIIALVYVFWPKSEEDEDTSTPGPGDTPGPIKVTVKFYPIESTKTEAPVTKTFEYVRGDASKQSPYYVTSSALVGSNCYGEQTDEKLSDKICNTKRAIDTPVTLSAVGSYDITPDNFVVNMLAQHTEASEDACALWGSRHDNFDKAYFGNGKYLIWDGWTPEKDGKPDITAKEDNLRWIAQTISTRGRFVITENGVSRCVTAPPSPGTAPPSPGTTPPSPGTTPSKEEGGMSTLTIVGISIGVLTFVGGLSFFVYKKMTSPAAVAVPVAVPVVAPTAVLPQKKALKKKALKAPKKKALKKKVAVPVVQVVPVEAVPVAPVVV